MKILAEDRTRILKDHVADFRPSDIIRKFQLGGTFKAESLEFFSESCDALASYSVDDLWWRYGSHRGSAFYHLLDFRAYSLKMHSKPKIQIIRDEFERIGIQPRPINFDDIAKQLPIFCVDQHFTEVTVHGNLYDVIKADKKKVLSPYTLRTTTEELSEILSEIPTGIGEEAFWKAARAYEVIQKIKQAIEKEHHEFSSERHRSERRKTAPPITIRSGKYAGKSGYLLDESGSHVVVEVEMAPENWIQTRLPATSIEKAKRVQPNKRGQ